MSDLSENRQALFDWVENERPDMLDDLRCLLETAPAPIGDGMRFIAGAAFEAGRFFQHVNPICGLGVVMPGHWKRIVDALAAYHEGNTLPEQE